MTTQNQISTDENMRQMFKQINRYMVLAWRLGLGKWMNAYPKQAGQYLVINHIGRKSGIIHQTPVNYAIVDGDVYITAGFGSISDWYRNLKANPRVEIWMADGRWDVEMQELGPDVPERLRIMRQVLIGSGPAAESLAGISPVTASDEELARISADYRLLRLKRLQAHVGSGGPGDLVWVWPAALAGIALFLWLIRRK